MAPARSYTLAAVAVLLGILPGFGSVRAQPDPRRHHHSVNIVPFVREGGQFYYLSWASSLDEEWEHDIYAKIVHVDAEGRLVVDRPTWRFVGSGDDGAQEPVSVALAPRRNVLLSAWEDGTDLSVVVDVRGQLHTPEGHVVRRNFQIAGGPDAQHSAAAAHCGTRFLVAYADEAPPARYATVMVKVLDDSTGEIVQTLRLTSDNDDNWWPVVASDGKRHVLVVWGNGESLSASVLIARCDTFRAVSPRRILGSIDQYFYHVRWVEALQHFLTVARDGSASWLCWVDTLGVPSSWTRILAPVTRETRFAVLERPGETACTVAYTTGANQVALISASLAGSHLVRLLSPETHESLSNVRWVSTGIALEFVAPVQGHFADGLPRLLIAQNRDDSDDICTLLLRLSSLSSVQATSRPPLPQGWVTVYPSPTRGSATLVLRVPRSGPVRVDVVNVLGRVLRTVWEDPLAAGVWELPLSLENLVSGLYLVRVRTAAGVTFTKVVVLK